MKTIVFAIAVTVFTACSKENVQPSEGKSKDEMKSYEIQKNLPPEKVEASDIIRCGTPSPQTKTISTDGYPIYFPSTESSVSGK